MRSLILILALFGVTLATPTLNATMQYAIFEPENEIDDKENPGTYVNIRLAQAPASTATVYFEAVGLRWSSCGLRFTKDDWNIPKKVYVTGVPLADGSLIPTLNNSIAVKYTIEAVGSVFHSFTSTFTMFRKSRKTAVCTSWGDPHYVLPDGGGDALGKNSYSYQGVGDYYLLKTERLVIQTRTDYCGAKVTCNRVIAVQYLNQVIFFWTPEGKTAVTDVTNNTYVRYGTGQWAHNFQISHSVNKRGWIVHTPDRLSFTVNMGFFNGHNYLDISVNLPAHYYGKTSGLCSTWNEVTELVMRDTKVTKEFSVFAESWKVPHSENLITMCPSATKCSVLTLVVPRDPAAECICTIAGKLECRKKTCPDGYTPIDKIDPVVPSTTTTTTKSTTTTTKAPTTTTTTTTTKAPTTTTTTTTTTSTTTTTTTTSGVNPGTTTTTSGGTSGVNPGTTTTTSGGNPGTTTGSGGTPTGSVAPGTVTTTTTSSVPAPTEGPDCVPCKWPVMPPMPDDFVKDVRRTCNAIMIDVLTPYVKADIFIEFCVTDCLAVGSLDFVDQYKQRYASHARFVLESVLDNTNDEVVASNVTALKKAVGFGEHGCPNNCNGNGYCDANACMCNTGYTGFDCSHKFVNVAQPAYGGYGTNYSTVANITSGGSPRPAEPSTFNRDIKTDGTNGAQTQQAVSFMVALVALVGAFFSM